MNDHLGTSLTQRVFEKPASLSVSSATYAFHGSPRAMGPFSLEVESGEFWGVIGPNGAGKSTLLRLLAGLLRPQSGQVMLNGRDLSSVVDRQRGRSITFVPQHPPCDLDMTVYDVVLLARYPHRSFGLFESAEDHRVVQAALQRTGVSALADRPFGTLSGGEAQRVHLSAAIAQDTPIMLLDEPTTSLDLKHQLEMLDILRDQVVQARRAVVMVCHDVNLTALFCTNVLLLHEGRIVAAGVPPDIITPIHLEPVYGVSLAVFSSPHAPQTRWLAPTGARSSRL